MPVHGTRCLPVPDDLGPVPDPANQLAFANVSLEVNGERLRSFQPTVAELVSSADLETVLQRIVQLRSRSTSASGFVLLLQPGPLTTRRVFAAALDEEQGAETDADVISCRWYSFDPFAHRRREQCTIAGLCAEAPDHDVGVPSFDHGRLGRSAGFDLSSPTEVDDEPGH
jgi:hypothetical protein